MINLMKKIEYLKVVFILPGNVLVTIPLIIFLFTRSSYTYSLLSPYDSFFYLAVFFLVLGLTLAIWSVRTFYSKGGDGTPGPWKPISNLIISGPYRYVRNPMLLGVFFLLLFESIFFTSKPLFYWFIIFLLSILFTLRFLKKKN